MTPGSLSEEEGLGWQKRRGGKAWGETWKSTYVVPVESRLVKGSYAVPGTNVATYAGYHTGASHRSCPAVLTVTRESC